MSSPQPVSDFWVRFGHWLIVLGVVFQQFSGEELKRIDTDTSVGLLLSGSVVFRLARGFVGPKHARFWIFIKKTEWTSGHTTIGGLVSYLMLILIGLTMLSGMTSSDDILSAGEPLKHLYRQQQPTAQSSTPNTQ